MIVHRVSESGILNESYDNSNNELVKVSNLDYKIIASDGVISAFNCLLSNAINKCDKICMRESINNLESELMKMDQSDHGLYHTFCDGLYIRVAEIKAGVLFTTPEYKEECILTILKGKILVITDSSMEVLNAPVFIKTLVGVKRVIFVVEDLLCHTVHHNITNETDVKTLEARIYGGLS